MKTKGVIFALIIVLFTICGANAQAPQGISYQSVVRNTAGTPQISTPVAIRFSVLQGSSTGTPVYVETQSFTTNAQGLVSGTIGVGTPSQGTFNTIDWSSGSYYLQVEADINNQGSYQAAGVNQIFSVPYSLYSEKAGSVSLVAGDGIGIVGNTITNSAPNATHAGDVTGSTVLTIADGAVGASKLSSMGASVGDVIQWDGSTWKPVVIVPNATHTGDVTGSTVLTIADGAVGASKLSSMGANIGDVIQWDGSTWKPVVIVPNATHTGDVTGSTALTIADGAVSASKLSSMGATVGQILKWDGSSWKPVVDSSNTTWGQLNGNTYTVAPGNVGIGTDIPVGKLEVKGSSSDPNVALFEVKDKNGNPIFSVYPTGVEIIYDETAPLRSSKGGFAVSGRNSTRAVVDIMRVTTDSTTIIVNNLAKRSSEKGGFAVSGRNSTRGNSDILRVTPDSTRIYTADPTKGFGVGEIGTSNVESYLKLLPDNYFIGHQSGQKTTGLYNTFIGYNAGIANTTGSSNIFIGYEVGKTNSIGSFNTFLGYQAGFTNNASYNSFIGYHAGRSTTTGQYNSFIGYKAGFANTTGYSNVFMGDSVAVSNTYGNQNVMLGNLAGKNNTGGSNNVYIGYQAGFLGVSGGQNICIGNYAGYSNTTGQNLFIGEYAGEKNTSGSRNSCVGFFSGQMNVTGGQNSYFGQFAGMDNLSSYNTFIGYWSGGNNITGTKNAYLGYRSGQASTGSNNVFLGYMTGENCTGTGNVHVGYMAGYGSAKSDALYIANSNTATPLIGGDFVNARVGIGMMPVTNALEVSGNASKTTAGSWLANSDRRIKTQITDIDNAISIIQRLHPVKFKYTDEWRKKNPSIQDRFYFNYIAQEYQTVFPDAVKPSGEYIEGDSNQILQLDSYDAQIVSVKAIQELIKENAELKARITQLEEMVKKISNK